MPGESSSELDRLADERLIPAGDRRDVRGLRNRSNLDGLALRERRPALGGEGDLEVALGLRSQAELDRPGELATDRQIHGTGRLVSARVGDLNCGAGLLARSRDGLACNRHLSERRRCELTVGALVIRRTAGVA